MRTIKRTLRHHSVTRLSVINEYDRSIYSQNGEDGILHEIFARIPHVKFFVEIGVQDGLECNTALLSRHFGWRGVMIEGSESDYRLLRSNYREYSVHCEQCFVDRDNVTELLSRLKVPEQLGLLSIDIDGNDLWVWEALDRFSPAVVVIEYNASLGASESRSIPYNPRHTWKRDRFFGASLAALAKIGFSKGYVLIGTNRSGVNAFFIKASLLEFVGFPQLQPAQAWHANTTIGRFLPAGSNDFVEI